ncbi:MAG: hypothetical protein ACLFMO_06210 [Eubacteriales bacterium]
MRKIILFFLVIIIVLGGCQQKKVFDHGKIVYDVYTNSYFNMKMDLPSSGWEVMDYEEIIETDTFANEEGDEEGVPLLTILREVENDSMYEIEGIIIHGASEHYSKEEVETNLSYYNILGISELFPVEKNNVEIDNQKFDVFEVDASNVFDAPIIRTYLGMVKGGTVVITISYLNDDTLKELESMLEGITFEQD